MYIVKKSRRQTKGSNKSLDSLSRTSLHAPHIVGVLPQRRFGGHICFVRPQRRFGGHICFVRLLLIAIRLSCWLQFRVYGIRHGFNWVKGGGANATAVISCCRSFFLLPHPPPCHRPYAGIFFLFLVIFLSA